MTDPPMPSRGMDILAWAYTLWRFALQTRPRVGPGIELRETPSGTIISLAPVNRSSAADIPCPFGSVVSITTETGSGKAISGGLLVCGNKNFEVPYLVIDTAPETTSTSLVYISIPCEANRDDDGEIILPGVKTSSSSAAAMQLKPWTEGTNYDDTSNPDAATGIGTIVIGLGKLTITAGKPSFAPTACGKITVIQCGGVLDHSRA